MGVAGAVVGEVGVAGAVVGLVGVAGAVVGVAGVVAAGEPAPVGVEGVDGVVGVDVMADSFSLGLLTSVSTH